MVEQCTAGCAANGNIPGLIYRSLSNDLFVSGQNLNYILNWRFNVSYVTGSHSFKAGYASNLLGDLRRSNMAPNNMDFRVNNGVPNQITMYVNQFQQDLWMRDDGYFAQEQWTHKRLTLQGAVRLDHALSWAPDQQEGPANAGYATLDRDQGVLELTEGDSEDDWIQLENGIEIQFEEGGDYTAGDYWLIPARTATGDVEWPQELGDPAARPPTGIRYFYAPLAYVSAAGNVSDMRSTFKPLQAASQNSWSISQGRPSRAPGTLGPTDLGASAIPGGQVTVGFDDFNTGATAAIPFDILSVNPVAGAVVAPFRAPAASSAMP